MIHDVRCVDVRRRVVGLGNRCDAQGLAERLDDVVEHVDDVGNVTDVAPVAGALVGERCDVLVEACADHGEQASDRCAVRDVCLGGGAFVRVCHIESPSFVAVRRSHPSTSRRCRVVGGCGHGHVDRATRLRSLSCASRPVRPRIHPIAAAVRLCDVQIGKHRDRRCLRPWRYALCLVFVRDARRSSGGSHPR